MSSAQKHLTVMDAYAVKNRPQGTQVFWNILHTAPVTHLEPCWTAVSPYSHFICSLQGLWSRMNAAGQREGQSSSRWQFQSYLSSALWLGHDTSFCPECLYGLWFLVFLKQEESHLAIIRKICESKALLFLRRQQRSQFYQINQIKCKLRDLQGLGNPVRSKLLWVFLSCVLLTGLVPHGESGMPLFNEVLLVTSGRIILGWRSNNLKLPTTQWNIDR